MALNSTHSKIACYIGYVIQAIVNTLAPLLYAYFNTALNISLELLGLIATINFCVQIVTDLASPFIQKLMGIRGSVAFSQATCVVGLCSLGVLPLILSSAYVGIIIATVFMAIGGGLCEVFLSPIMQAIPSKEKESNMMLLHSFYAWGQCLVVLLSTFFFVLFSITNWQYLPFIWAIIPLFNFFLFLKVPLFAFNESATEKNTSIFKQPIFWLLFLLMISAGASELAISTWASTFAELGLGVNKTVGDILGPCMFAFFLGLGRLLLTFFLKRFKLTTLLLCCSICCFIFYCVAIFVPNSFISLLGCAFSGFSVAIMWPGTYSLGAEKLKNGGTLTFSLLAFAGDIGCSLSSFIVGYISEQVTNNSLSILTSIIPSNGLAIRTGLLFSLVFPLISIIILSTLIKKIKKIKTNC